MGQAILGVFGLNFRLFFLNIRVSIRFFPNYIIFDDNIMMEHKIVYLFLSNIII